jgi:mannose-6-phosphate isomerase-like protein (cupin superfamily)
MCWSQSGAAKIVNGEKEFTIGSDESSYLPAGNPHRLSNPGDVDCVMIEVQSGDYLGEDDIVRLEDHYGRVPASSKPLSVWRTSPHVGCYL